ncbi:MAG: DNA mismatch endonuclease Vsr [Mesorhizobium sp.]|uniref:very short patch repair endonuclease n=1 Tax=Mesorhizobium sp. TaxID=1871066 RepID=UPI001219D6BE|nr:very short patch repair endonuclease [Mesorhizobium sp.]TIT20139.1 MAG: DNA mismatch endonuclease Vsr [Mesorhizobium sp.]
MDIFDPIKRSAVMACVRSKNTKPELRVRSYLHRRGLRYVIHDKRLPGNPDIAFPSRRVVVFVHGCFWHGHNCKKGRPPSSRSDYWLHKIEGNRTRDEMAARRLLEMGWDVIVIWECLLSDRCLEEVTMRIREAAIQMPRR